MEKMQEKVREFVSERNWDKFHTPKNISMALSIEASELLELFLWLSDQEALEVKSDPIKMKNIQDEIADVLYWILRLTDLLKIDLNQAFWNKMQQNEQKYPVALSKGNAKKYTEFTNAHF